VVWIKRGPSGFGNGLAVGRVPKLYAHM
jgi:hypothetical protein